MTLHPLNGPNCCGCCARVEEQEEAYQREAARADALEKVVREAAGMGGCSQSHHDWVIRHARAVLPDTAAAKPDDDPTVGNPYVKKYPLR